eukprot:PhF_6_TR25308/c0_g1_i1/m.34939
MSDTSVCFTPIYAILSFVTHPFLETDNFSQNCRKHLFSASLAIWIIVFIQNIVLIPAYTEDPAHKIVEYNDSLIILLGIPALYYRMWKERNVSDGVVTLWVLGTLLVFLFQAIRDANAGTPIYVQVLMVSAVVSQAPKPHYLCAIGLGIIALQYYNLIAVTRNTSGYVPLMLAPEWSNRSPCNEFLEVTHILRLTVIGVLVWLVRAQTRAFNKQLFIARTSTNTARRVAELLGAYKTEEAARVLREESKSCDSGLVDVLDVIVRNMDAYRPYLPNYLLCPVHAGETKGSDLSTPHSNVKSPKSFGSVEDLTETEQFAVSPLHDGVFHTRSVTLGMFSFRDLYRWELQQRSEPPTLKSSISEYITLVHEVATSQRAAVHGFLGDDVMMTWNATTKCSDHSIRAAITMMELRRGCAHDFETHGALVMGPTRCQRGGKNTIAWTLHAPRLFKELEVMYHLASCKVGGLLVSGSVAEQIEHSATMQMVDAFLIEGRCVIGDSTPNATHTTTTTTMSNQRTSISDGVVIVHELLQVFFGGQSVGDEWMYQIQTRQQSQSTHNQINEITKMALSGSQVQALSSLEDIVRIQSGSNVTPGMMHLLRRLGESSTNGQGGGNVKQHLQFPAVFNGCVF